MIIDWIFGNYLELFGVVSGLLFLYLEIKQKLWLWPVGLITSAVYIIVFYKSGFYADMALQVYYVVISVYGWWHWLSGRSENLKSNNLPITRLTAKLAITLFAVSVILWIAMWFVLSTFTDSQVPIGDSFTTALSIVATWMLARKIIEQWWVWGVVNLVSLSLYLYKGLYPTSVLFVFYTTMVFVGYIEWRKSEKNDVLTR